MSEKKRRKNSRRGLNHIFLRQNDSRENDGGMNFSWVIEGHLAGCGAPASLEDLLWLRQRGIRALVRLVEEEFAEIDRHEVEDAGIMDFHEPMQDFVLPDQEQISRVLLYIEKELSMQKPVCVSCMAGKGRTGCLLACFLVRSGISAHAAIEKIRALRPGSLDCAEMEEAVRLYEMRIRRSRESP